MYQPKSIPMPINSRQDRVNSVGSGIWMSGIIFFICSVAVDPAIADGPASAELSSVPKERWPAPNWTQVNAADVGVDVDQLEQAKQYALSAGGSGMIVHGGQVLMHWGDQQQRYDIKSATKSIGAMALGIAVDDGKIDLAAAARQYHPAFGSPPESNRSTGWLDQITIAQLATHTAGFDKRGGYEPLLFPPGTHWHYSDGGPNWLAECITLQYQQDLEELMFQRVFGPLGISHADLQWRSNQYRPREIRPREMQGVSRREFGAGVHANVDALARIGYLHLRRGRWQDQQLLSAEFVDTATQPFASLAGIPNWDATLPHKHASAHYGLLWWNNADRTLPQVPADAYWAWGLYDSLILVIPSLDLVVVRGGAKGKSWPRGKEDDDYQVLAPFFNPIVAAIGTWGQEQPAPISTPDPPSSSTVSSAVPYAPSDLIASIEWAAKESIIRMATGSDNWPLTWADDDQLYTAYGDGWGFEPHVEKKLSLGLARIDGVPPNIQGTNLRSADVERTGQGAHGLKASGMLMIDSVLYMWVRNADNSQLAWSEDRGQSWTWSSWKWTTSFGCPTFLNYGRDYAGAKDSFVYVYSFDSDSAYQPGDQMVLARVPQDRLRDAQAYEYFAGFDEENLPLWTADVGGRQSVFSHPSRCYRSGISYNAPLDRYLWCQIYPESSHKNGTRFQGGFGIYDAPQPWGPWTTVFHTDNWDVGPGETSSFPTKWISSDGLTLHLVFSGDDCFSVRQARLILRR